MTATDPAAGRHALTADADVAAAEAERDFLIRSLEDLDAEHDAGDLDEADYRTLKDDYTVRAAAVLRAIDGAEATHASVRAPALKTRSGSGRGAGATGKAAGSASGLRSQALGSEAAVRRRRRRTAVIAAVIVAFVAAAAWTMTSSTGARVAGQSVSGDNRALSPNSTAAAPTSPAATGGATVDARLVSAAQLVNQGKVAEALQLYDEILKDSPRQPVALANDGWLLAQAGLAGAGNGLVDTGLAKITQSEQIDPTNTTVHFFRGFLLLKAKNDPGGAVTELRSYLGAVDPSSPEVPQVEQLLSDAISAAGPNVPVGPNAPTTVPG